MNAGSVGDAQIRTWFVMYQGLANLSHHPTIWTSCQLRCWAPTSNTLQRNNHICWTRVGGTPKRWEPACASSSRWPLSIMQQRLIEEPNRRSTFQSWLPIFVRPKSRGARIQEWTMSREPLLETSACLRLQSGQTNDLPRQPKFQPCMLKNHLLSRQLQWPWFGAPSISVTTTSDLEEWMRRALALSRWGRTMKKETHATGRGKTCE